MLEQEIKGGSMKRYRVIEDLQGGSFGMDRDYTADEWVEQAREWCWADDNTDLDDYLEDIQKYRSDWEDWQILDLINDIWQIEFAEVKTIDIKGRSEQQQIAINFT